MAEWIEYDGSDRQIAEIKGARYGVIFKHTGLGMINDILFPYKDRYIIANRLSQGAITHYLICEPHQHATMIKFQADTGQPVYIQYLADASAGLQSRRVTMETQFPDWNIPGAEYSFEPFEEETK